MAVILDYGIRQADGTWTLASTGVNYASVADITALAHTAGTEWRTEDLQSNPLADLPVDEIGVYFINGDAFEFNLRNYEVNLATLDEVNSTDDSTYRVEKLTPAQFHFATSLGGIEFRPEMLTKDAAASAAANDNEQASAWRGAAFRFAGWEMAA
jgi:hypothetical protein